MKKRKKYLGFILIAALLLQTGVGTIWAEDKITAEEAGVVVTTSEAFLAALSQKQSPIIVAGSITIGSRAESSGRMLPEMIPEGTTILGQNGGSINARCPIQLAGDNVVIKDLKMTFESSDALGSIVHREIFLAGHSLTLDHVSTYLEGSGGSLGSLGSSEKELLPTVYAGGYPGTAVGTNASLTIQNSGEETMLKGIYMSHTQGEDDNEAKEPYYGNAYLCLDPNTVVREGIYTTLNSHAVIDLEGEGSAKADRFYGNAHTVLNIRKSEVSNATIEEVGSVVLDNGAWLALKSETLHHVTVKNRSCLDFSGVGEAFITGDFCGQDTLEEGSTEELGILVLNQNGCLTISGDVSGTTQFQTGHKLFPGFLISGTEYILTNQKDMEAIPFLLPEQNREAGFELRYQEGAWIAYKDGNEDIFEIGSIEIPFAKTEVDLDRIREKTDEEIYCNIIWRDKSGQVIDDEKIETEFPYEYGYMFIVKTEYWESNDSSVLEKTDWSNSIILERSAENPQNYLMRAWSDAKSGTYTFLFCSELIWEDLNTVADIKGIKDFVIKELCVTFYDSSEGETPSKHHHSYYAQITKEASCVEAGEETWICSGCNDTYTEPISAKGHTIVTDPAKEASCTEAGKTEGSHCSVCEEVITAQEETAKKPHTIVTDPAEEASCTETGKTEGSHCSICEEVIAAQETVQKKPHDYQTNLTKASIGKNGYSETKCTLCGEVAGLTVIYAPKTVTLSAESYLYSGKENLPSVTVIDSDGKTISSSDYAVTYQNQKDVGIAEVVVRFQNRYEGSLTKTFQILPKPTKLVKVTAKSKGMQVKWKKERTQTTGYRIQYSTSKKFVPKNTKLVVVKKNKTASQTIKKLKAGKTYFVRICTYKTVKAGEETVELCSSWSKVKKVKIGKA